MKKEIIQVSEWWKRNVWGNDSEHLIARKHKHHVFCVNLNTFRCTVNNKCHWMRECQLAFYFDYYYFVICSICVSLTKPSVVIKSECADNVCVCVSEWYFMGKEKNVWMQLVINRCWVLWWLKAQRKSRGTIRWVHRQKRCWHAHIQI